MAQRILGRGQGSPSYYRGIHRIASHTTGRRYRAACRRAERYARFLHMGRRAAFLWMMLWQTLWPLRHVLGLVLYAAAGAGILVRDWRLGQQERVLEQDEENPQATWQRYKKRSHVRINTALVFLFVGFMFFTLSTYGIGLEVIMNGESIGFIANQAVFEDSLDNVNTRATEILGYSYTVQPQTRFRFSVVKRDRIYNSAEVENRLLLSIPEIEALYVLRVEGEIVGAARSVATLQGVLDGILADYPLPEGAAKPVFIQEYDIQRQLCSLRMLKDAADLRSLLESPVRDELRHTVIQGETAQSIAQSYGITLESLMQNNPSLAGEDSDDIRELAAGEELLMKRGKPLISVQYTITTTRAEVLPFTTEYVVKQTLWEGETELITEGRDGTNLLIERYTVVDGYPPQVEPIGSYVGVAPITQIVAAGNRERISTGVFIRPFGGVLTSPYGWRKLFNAMHSGTDFAGKIGEEIIASDGGIISFAGARSGYGLLVIIDHMDGYQTYYGHCSKILVEVGQQVGQGEVISLIGNTGRSTGPHVHFEIRLNGKTYDPMKYLKKD